MLRKTINFKITFKFAIYPSKSNSYILLIYFRVTVSQELAIWFHLFFFFRVKKPNSSLAQSLDKGIELE